MPVALPSIEQHPQTHSERIRLESLAEMFPRDCSTALDVGARDGYVCQALLPHVGQITAVDLEKPNIALDRVTCVSGNATALKFADASFDLVVCTEVLEHIPEPGLSQATAELARVSRKYVLIGVPYKQDIRVASTTCQRCGKSAPGYGHVNRFDEDRLAQLFPGFSVVTRQLVGSEKSRTTMIAAALMRLGGNPWGAYAGSCGHCGEPLIRPQVKKTRKPFAHTAVIMNRAQNTIGKTRPIWVHTLFTRSL